MALGSTRMGRGDVQRISYGLWLQRIVFHRIGNTHLMFPAFPLPSLLLNRHLGLPPPSIPLQCKFNYEVHMFPPFASAVVIPLDPNCGYRLHQRGVGEKFPVANHIGLECN